MVTKKKKSRFIDPQIDEQQKRAKEAAAREAEEENRGKDTATIGTPGATITGTNPLTQAERDDARIAEEEARDAQAGSGLYSANPFVYTGGTGTDGTGTDGTGTDGTDANIEINIPDFDLSGITDILNSVLGSEIDDLRKQLESLEEQRFVPTLDVVKTMVPWLSGTGNLLQIYQDSWAESGNPDIALATVRDSEDYDTLFPGNKRADGSVRWGESEYKSIESGYVNVLHENGLDSSNFQSKFGQLISGNVSPDELKERVALKRRAIEDNPASKDLIAFYADNYGIEMSEEGLLASLIDPSVSEEILNKRITMAEIAGEAKYLAGTELGMNTLEALFKAGIDTQGEAEKLFTQASEESERLSQMAASQGREGVSVEELVQAKALEDPEAAKEISRVLQQAKSSSSVNIGAKKSQGGKVIGLTEGT
tara:strand:- start:975 stop:2249 length:1275 start_codon:yes stop_codon:yes gene_type:complete